MATEPPSLMLCYDAKIHPKANMEPPWNDTSVFLGNDEQIFPEPLSTHETQQKNVWDYFQISRRRCSRRNFIRALWSK